MSKLFYIIILILTVIHVPAFELNPMDYNTDSKLPMKDLKTQATTKASALNTSTWFSGETVYLTFDNGSIGHYNSSYKYNAINNISHQISFYIDSPYSPGLGHKNISIFSPCHWNLTYMNPVEEYIYCLECCVWEFNFTQGVDTTYNITFFSGETYGVDYARQNQYLAIENKNGYSADNFTSTFDSTTVNTTVTAHCIPSIRFVDNTNAAGNATINLSPGQYYISVWFFLESQNSTTGTLDLQVNNLGVEFLDLESYLDKRWNRLFFYLEVNTMINSLSFVSSATKECVFFLGCFDLWQANPSFVNTDTIYQYNVSSTLINWNLYPIDGEAVGVAAETVNYDIRDRTANTTGISFQTNSSITDATGFSSWIYTNSSLDQRELDLQVWNWKSWWGTPLDQNKINPSEDLVGWKEFDADTSDLSLEDGQNNTAVRLSGDGDALFEIDYDYSTPQNLQEITHIRIIIKNLFNGTIRSGSAFRLRTNPANNFVYSLTGLITNDTFLTFELNFADDFADFGSPNIESIANFITFTQYIGDQNAQHYLQIETPQFIQAQKTFYQPKTTTDHLFYHETIDSLDEWDFIEGYAENWTAYLELTNTFENGLMNSSITGSSYALATLLVYEDVNAEYYNSASIRIRGSENGLRIRFTTELGDFLTDYISLTTSFAVYSSILDTSYWKNNQNATGILLYDSSGLFEGNESFYIDYIRLYHEDTPILKEATAEWWLTSQNDSYTYSYTVYGSTSTTTDLTHIIKTQNGLHNLTYSAYLDSNYASSLLLPSDEVSTTIYVDVYDPVGFARLLDQAIEMILILIIFGTLSLLSIFVIYKLWQAVF